MVYNQFSPSITAPLEEWDNTTDVIVWLIEQKTDFHLSIPQLELETLPETYHGSGRFVTPESQSATLIGWTEDNHKVKFAFTAEYIERSTTDENGEEYSVEGYTVTVEKQDPATFKMKPYRKYTVKGTDRRDFELTSEEIKQ